MKVALLLAFALFIANSAMAEKKVPRAICADVVGEFDSSTFSCHTSCNIPPGNGSTDCHDCVRSSLEQAFDAQFNYMSDFCAQTGQSVYYTCNPATAPLIWDTPIGGNPFTGCSGSRVCTFSCAG